MKMLHTQLAKKNEKGIALIFTLIMLSLLLILALAFALDSMSEQKAAYNAASASSARILAEAQLKQVLTMIKAGETNFAEGNICSKDITYNTASPIEHSDMLKEQTPPAVPYSRLRVYGVLDENNDNSCLTGTPPKANWNYIRSGSDNRIIGRTAFVLIPDAKVPLDSLVDDRVGTTSYPKHNETNDTETRIGKYVSEINVRAAIPGVTTNISTITDKLNWKGTTANLTIPGFDAGLYTSAGWGSFTKLFTDIPEIAVAEQPEVISNLSLSVADDKEAFWADKNANMKIDDHELFRRFDLTRTDWDGLNTHADDLTFIKTQILLDSGSAGVPTQAMQEWLDADTNTTKTPGLPWLACFGYKTDGTGVDANFGGTFGLTVAGVAARRNQIAANLKDYCDTDSRPTSDVDPTTWTGASVPTFTGNERTPYINKIGVRIDCTMTNLTDPSMMTVSVKPYVGLIDIYEDIYPNNLEVIVEGTVSAKVSFNGGSDIPFTDFTIKNTPILITGGVGNDWDVAGGSAGHSTFKEGIATSPAQSETVIGAGASAKVTVTNVTITKVILYDPVTNIGYDYVRTLTSSPSFAAFDAVVAGTATGWLGFEANDPRQNLNAEDWVTLTGQSSVNTCFAVTAAYECQANAGNVNAVVGAVVRVGPNTGGANYDPETNADPANANLSTAFIRNAPMESPWELGFIHRGKMWQTINLKKYVPSKGISTITIGGNKYIAGGGLYSEGDANILDQIKMTAEPKSPQKINLNALDAIFFEALFSKVKLGCIIEKDCSLATYMSVVSMAATGGTELTAIPTASAQTTFFGDKIITKYKSTTNPEERLTRASVVDTLLLPQAAATPAIAAGTDAAQEELIGKIVNLTKIGNATGNFTIIVLAQTIKDVEGTIFKYSADETQSGTLPCTLGTFDAIINPTTNSSVYFDEITSEQKILVTGSYTGGVLKITSFQYIE